MVADIFFIICGGNVTKPGTVCITGASSGIGRATALEFARHGYAISMCARREGRLIELSDELRSQGASKVFTAPCDVSNTDAVQSFCDETLSALGHVDVLVNNAGGAIGAEHIVDASEEDWTTMINCNVLGLLRMTRYFATEMKRRKSGHIVNIGSISGHQVYEGGVVYCATKHAVKVIAEGLKLELNGLGIRVSSIDPGMVNTEFSTVRFRGNAERANNLYKGMTPLVATDIAELVYFVATRPKHVNIDNILVTPTEQASVHKISKTRSP